LDTEIIKTKNAVAPMTTPAYSSIAVPPTDPVAEYSYARVEY